MKKKTLNIALVSLLTLLLALTTLTLTTTTKTKSYAATDNLLTFTAEEAGSTLSYDWYSGTVQYSTDGGTSWNEYSNNTTLTLANIGDIIKFKGNSINGDPDNDDEYSFVMTGKISASGDVTSLVNGEGGDVALTRSFQFADMFSGCASLTTAPNLPSTNLAEGCYAYMFSGCTSLTTVPELPATTLVEYCYTSMFHGCTGLKMYADNTHQGYTKAWSIPANATTATNWNSGMFSNCTDVCCESSNPVVRTVYYIKDDVVEPVPSTGFVLSNNNATIMASAIVLVLSLGGVVVLIATRKKILK